MCKKARTTVIVLLAVLVSVYAVTVAAFAQDQETVVTPENDGQTSQISLPPNGSSSDSSSSSGSGSSSGSSNSQSSSSEESSGTVTVVFNLNGGTGLKSKASVAKGTKVSELKVPVKKGYQFAGWASGTAAVSGSMPIESDITLDAQWQKAAPAESTETPAPAASVDTRQSAIDAAASEAAQATSEPGTTSENWDDLLSSEESGSSVLSQASSAAPSSAVPSTGGGFSTLLLVGIILIVVGIAGVGVFIYLQFIRKGPGGRGGSGPSGSGKVGDDTAEFTDISSYSDGKKHDSAPGGPRRHVVKSAPEDTRVIGPIDPAYDLSYARGVDERRTPESRQERSERSRILREKSQAKPVEDAASDFNWEKFFNE